MMKLKRRKPAKKLALARRFQALTSNEQVELANCKFWLGKILYGMTKVPERSLEKKKRLRKAAKIVFLQYIWILYRPIGDPVHNPRKYINFDTFNESDCRALFRFLKPDLTRLKLALQIPDSIVIESGYRVGGEELMLRALFELSTGCDQYEVAVVFGGDQPFQSRVLKWFMVHVYRRFHYLLSDNLEWWYDNGYLHASMHAINKKIKSVMNWQEMDANLYDVGLFIDCNCMSTARPGGGPAEEGVGSIRWDTTVQKAFYNGWKSIHGLKHQTVDCAYGMTVDLFGPWSLRRNDCKLLSESNIIPRLRDMQQGQPVQVKVYGDSIYPHLSHLRSKFENPAPAEGLHNNAFKKARISIEWNYMTTASLFGYICKESKLKIMGTYNVAKVYTVVTLLKNCFVACYGCETSNYFGIQIPKDMLEQYMRVN
jgi:hypothetical protein